MRRIARIDASPKPGYTAVEHASDAEESCRLSNTVS
jgi:hypothetical protein